MVQQVLSCTACDQQAEAAKLDAASAGQTLMSGSSIFSIQNLRDPFVRQAHAARPVAMDQGKPNPPLPAFRFCGGWADRRDNLHAGPFRQRRAFLKHDDAVLDPTDDLHAPTVARLRWESRPSGAKATGSRR